MPDTFAWTGTQHAQFQGLLADIRSDPDDVGLRLILSDWLEEHADLLPRDETESLQAWSRLIRIQYAREQTRTHAQAEERQILSRFGRRWLEELQPHELDLEWQLGFLHLGGIVAELYPAVRDCDEAVFTRVLWMQPRGGGPGRGRSLEQLLALPQLSGLGGLDLSLLSNLGEPVARALAHSRHLRGLRHLNARGVGFGPEEFATLAGSPYLALHTLDLGYNLGGDDGVFALAESPMLRSVAVLRLQSNALTDAGAEALLESPHLGQVKELSLYANAGLSPAMLGRLEARFGVGVTW